MEKLTKEVSFLLMRLSVVRPIETRKFITVSRQYLNSEAEAIDMWKNVVVRGVLFVCVMCVCGGGGAARCGTLWARCPAQPACHQTSHAPPALLSLLRPTLTLPPSPHSRPPHSRPPQNSINLSEQQKMDIVQWKQLFMQKVEPIVEERKKLNVQIQAHLPQVCGVLMRGEQLARGRCVTAVGGGEGCDSRGEACTPARPARPECQ